MESNQGQTCIDPLPSGSVVCVIAALNRYSTWWSARSLSTCGWRFVRCLGSSKNLLYNIETNYAQQIYFYPTWLIMIRRPCSAVCCKCHLSLEITYSHYLLSYSIYSRHKKLILTHIHFTGFGQLPQYIFLANIVWKGPKMCWYSVWIVPNVTNNHSPILHVISFRL